LQEQGKRDAKELSKAQNQELGRRFQELCAQQTAAMAPKIEHFKRCRPLIYTQFKINDKYEGFFTNVQHDYAGGELQLRCKWRGSLAFRSQLSDRARQLHDEPTLRNVAELIDRDPEERAKALELLNWAGRF
jgi:hypothetical protein